MPFKPFRTIMPPGNPKLREVGSVYEPLTPSTRYGTPAAPAPPPLVSGAILHLDANNISGSSWPDVSGSGYNGTIYGTGSYTSANGGAYNFNGTNSYVQLPSGFSNFANGLSVFFIANFLPNSNSWERILDFANGPGNDNILTSRITTVGIWGTQVFLGGGGGTFAEAPTLSGTFCGATTQNNNIFNSTGKSYNNGVPYASYSGLHGPFAVTRTLNYIGRSNFAGDALFEGSISIVLMYNRQLTDAEVLQNYNHFKQRFSLP